MEFLFWASLFIVFYTFLGYGLLLFGILKLKRLFRKKVSSPSGELPTCTLIVAAYNEEQIIVDKIHNSLQLIYPEGRLKFIFVSDGSSDQTHALISEYPQIKSFYEPLRKGKIHAVHRVMQYVDTDVVVFTDANTFLNEGALLNICRHYADPTVGAVAGEKRVVSEGAGDATAGEGFYWKYESTLKKWDSELYSVVGAAGELFSIRRDLYVPVPENSILDDFMISMRIAEKGYRIVYEPEAYATESSSENVEEELKRKVRIAAGGIQSVLWLKNLLLPFRQPILSFQYISHRVLRWTVTPFLLILLLIVNIGLVLQNKGLLYELLLASQLLFYLGALLGLLLSRRQIKVKVLFIPYYFCLMNYAVIAGLLKFAAGGQSVLWEKAKRKSN